MTDVSMRPDSGTRPRPAVARLAYRAVHRLDGDALSADLDAGELVQAGGRDLLERLALALAASASRPTGAAGPACR